MTRIERTKATREKSEDVTTLHDMHEKLLSHGNRDVNKIVEVEKLIVESGEEIEPVTS